MAENTSFRNIVVDEIIASPIAKGDEVFAFISAIAKNAGTVNIAKKRINLVMSVDTYGVAMYLVEALKSVYPTEFEISCDEIKSGTKKGRESIHRGSADGIYKASAFGRLPYQ